MAKLLLDENGVIKSWQIVGGGWSDTEYITVEVDEIPDYVIETPEKYCYMNGGYIENPDYEEPVIPYVPTVEEIAHENELLKAQIQAQSEQMDFYEECIIEMAEIVYA